MKPQNWLSIYILLILFPQVIQSQVSSISLGVNTDKPWGLFHIDTQKNNTSVQPNPATALDDVIGTLNPNYGVQLQVGGFKDNIAAGIALLDPNKALLLNKVSLTSLKDVVTISNPAVGMIVYNKSTSGTFPNQITPGYYYFNGSVWTLWQYGKMSSQLSQIDLRSDCTSAPTEAMDNAVSPMKAALADFGTIKIKETGTYLFSLRLYGRPTLNDAGKPIAVFGRTVHYIYLMKNTSTKIDAVEINVPVPLGGLRGAYTHTLTMQATLNEGDVVSFRLGHYKGHPGWELIAQPGLMRANKTSLIYWKI